MGCAGPRAENKTRTTGLQLMETGDKLGNTSEKQTKTLKRIMKQGGLLVCYRGGSYRFYLCCIHSSKLFLRNAAAEGRQRRKKRLFRSECSLGVPTRALEGKLLGAPGIMKFQLQKILRGCWSDSRMLALHAADRV